jgi:adenylate cyclase
MAKVIVDSPGGRFEHVLANRQFIGRHPSCDIRVADPLASKRHGQIYRVGEEFVYEDANSVNGSFIAGIRVAKHSLRDGDEICIGKSRLMFRVLTDQEKMEKMVTMSHVYPAPLVQNRVLISGAHKFSPEQTIADPERLRLDYEKLRLGHQLLTEIGLERDLDSALSKISDKLLALFESDRCVILLIGRDKQLHPRYVKSVSGQPEHVAVSESVLREVQDTKAAILYSSDEIGGALAQANSLIMQGVHSVMCVPILHQGKLLGVIHLEKKTSVGCFKTKDLELLNGVAMHVALAIENSHLLNRVEEEAEAKVQFERLLSPAVADQVLRGKMRLDKGGDLRTVTILFADIRGFTSMSNRASATKIVSMLNWYFEAIVDVILRFDGTVDKYIGDEIMALFGAPLEMPDAPDKAVACALEMHRALEEMNKVREQYGEELIRIGIGINTGEVVVGSMGSSKTMQYTCIGEPVNVASRLTKLAKEGQVLISENTLNSLKTSVSVEPLPPVKVKGIEGMMTAYSVIRTEEDTTQKDTIENTGTSLA